MFNLDKLLNNKNIKKIQTKSNIDYHYLKTIVLVLGFLFMLYQLYDKNESLNLIKSQYDSNIEQITKLNSDIKTNKKKLKEETKEKLVGEGVGFERIRRITGYLVGTVDRFNNGKRAEERDRVKHGTEGLLSNK